ncbi:allantoate amidohydrolase [Siculibacillus lacustris]|uniref:Allantoate amidohydrolase n=1 Tax=Siculibacillus lacustris TaxID=1549641 RepID=A0A4Q9VNJ8_9HYPH|nr:allantoate amidohydrolase [Siculibacillus lacustris]
MESLALSLGSRAVALLDALALVTDEPGRVTRTYLSTAHARALDLVGDWMRERDLAVTLDAVATLRGRRPADFDPDHARTLLIGSHIDTVIDAGSLDGCLGVVAGLIAAEEIDRRGLKLPFALEILAFGDEEGVRFPTALSSSSAATGTFRREWLAAADRDGVTLDEALRRFGRDPEAIPAARIDPTGVVGWLEVHIEQGPRLEHWDLPLGVVTSIAGQSRFGFTLVGTAGHAGTVPMDLRRDALAGLAEIVLAVERIGRQGTGGLVATVGRVAVSPGAGNTVPGRVEATLDVRAGSDAPRLVAIDRIGHEARRIAERRGLDFTLERFVDVPTCPMDADLQEAFARAVGSLGLDTRRLTSGAGHDAMAMARTMPTAMLFVRSRDGISHNPREWSSPRDIGLAVEALIRCIVDLAEREARPAP